MAIEQKKGFGLLEKVVLFSAIPAFIIGGMLVYLYDRDLKEAITQKYIEEALVAASAIQQALPSDDIIKEPSLATPVLKEIIRMNPNFLYINIYAVVDGTIKTIASTDPEKIGQPADDDDVKPILTGEPVIEEKTEGDLHLLETIAPYFWKDKPVASIGFYASAQSRDIFVAHLSKGILKVALVGSLTILIAVFYVVHRVLLSPLKVLSRGSNLWARGRLSHRVPVKGRDEISHLAVSFNAMAESLEQKEIQRERAEEVLRKSEARFSGILDIAQEGIISVDEKQRVVIFNKGAEQIFGYSANEMVGQPLDRLLPESAKAVHQNHIEEFDQSSHKARRMAERREISGRRKGGEEFPAEASISKLEVDGHKIFTVVMRDVTERKNAEMEIQKLASFPTEDPNPVMRLDHHGTILYSNTGSQPVLNAWGCETGQPVPHTIQQILGDVLAYKRDRVIEVDYGEQTFTLRFSYPKNSNYINLYGLDITDRKRAEKQVAHQAHHDVLTDLPNRILLMDRLAQGLTRAPWNKRLVAVLFLDLDHFKRINDTLGHSVGDLLLKEVAERLKSCLRVGDSVARLGGDEFAVVLTDVARAEDVPVVARKMIEALSKPLVLEGHKLFITASIGISLYPNDGNVPEALLKNADMAMYRAKEQGRNNCQLYSHDLNTRTAERLAIENRLHLAVEREEFLLHYQPIIDLNTGQIVGMEALLRWWQNPDVNYISPDGQNPDLDLISPAKFIPLAEETGLIVPIGEWVLRTACAQNKAWQKAGFPPIRIAVNLSARQFQQQDMAAIVSRVLKETGLSPRFLELELTESILMKEVKRISLMLSKLNEMGVQLSIDDFGTGYSSLNYLKRFPINKLKVDMSFVRGITSDDNDAAIVTAIVTLAHNLKLKAIAEGVETEEQVETLRLLKCDEMQGYFFSRPLPAEEVTKLLTKKTSLKV